MNLFETLTQKNEYIQLGEYFIEKAIDSIEKGTGRNVERMSNKHIQFTLEFLLQRHTSIVFNLSQSPIEIAFSNSLMLCFLKNQIPLVTTHRFENTPTQLKEIKNSLKKLKEFIAYYGSKYKSLYISKEYLDEEVSTGRLPFNERDIVEDMIFYYHYNNFEYAYHFTLQPRIRLSSDNVSPDMLIWNPSRPKFKLFIECDGFKYHSSKKYFIRDRKRDRELQMKNYKVFRISGTEIYQSPSEAAAQLFDYLARIF